MLMSPNTMSGRTHCTRSTASRPFPTDTTSKSSSEKVSSMTFWIVMLSSSSSIYLHIAPNMLRRAGGSHKTTARQDNPVGPPLSTTCGQSGPCLPRLPDLRDDIGQSGARQEHLSDSHLRELGHVLRRDDPADEKRYAFSTLRL